VLFLRVEISLLDESQTFEKVIRSALRIRQLQ
jgi:hypothetical protein